MADPKQPDSNESDPNHAPVRTQMADIARLAGVSVSAVSRALRGKPDIGAETRKRIVDLAHSLNYTANLSAVNLRLKQNRSIGLVMPYMGTLRQQLTEPFFISLIASTANALSDRGFEILLSRVDAAHSNLAEPYHTGKAMGLIFTGQWIDHRQLNKLAVLGVPFVVWGEQQDQQLYRTVGSDNLHGGYLATRHLIEQGARRILIIGDFGSPELRKRREGYWQAHRDAGLAADPALVLPTQFDAAAVERDLELVLARGLQFDAVFACSDLTAMTVINVLIRHQRRVPDDVLVAGYDDIELADYFRPSLTTIRQPISVAGESMVAALLEQLDGTPAGSRKLPTILIRRDSTRR
jgi:DNA-binding LacI/PurR family transcriptional regulator